jgi:Protein of unknown function (DUF1615)
MKIIGAIFAMLLSSQTAQAQSPELSISETTRLIQATRKTVVEPRGWAIDLLDVLRSINQPASRENVCSAIAIIDQESNFAADPAVSGLGALAEKTLRAKADRIPILGRIVLQFLETTPSSKDSYMERIRSARTERDLDLTYRSMVADAGNRSNLSLVVESGLLNQMIEDRNDINTIGSMQVSVRFALENAKRRRWLPMSLSDVYAVRDELYTRHGGLYYGVLQLLDYESGYNRKIYRFADYNAGRYASRNAAFQNMISTLSKIALTKDGDLLLYDKNRQPLKQVSESEKALRATVAKYDLGIDDDSLRSDLLKEKGAEFSTTHLYRAVRGLMKLPLAFAEIPTIDLNSPKITHHMTTQNFAESVDKRYQKCVGR